MTYRLSSVIRQHRLCLAEPAKSACVYRSSARYTAAITPERSALFGSSNQFAIVSGAWHAISRTPDAALAPNVRALSP